ncbi:DNA polymerase IV [Anaerofustis stercorihominis]|uniref:DNA polymerase IV n=1 Tax=Anaerofustis stercorihominis TaxID=214853 RepID=UPI00210C2158|nr:DNA polymerase IV [Anaerofustis stercorihominis]MCQ4794085.1 DNA polymerase IV [Anaerofustis stercorihominis]
MDRVILHSDLNNFYASVECFYNPTLRNKPVAVSGNPELRHGIILAKNYIAKKYGIQTGEAIWQAKKKCPELICVSPHYDIYLKYSKLVKDIYADYTDKIESFGLDECWLDVTNSTKLFGSGEKIADEIRKRIKYELGITASVGVSFNKVFAKLGSDMKKPDATTVISKEDFKNIIWKLPVQELIYIGRATKNKLNKCGIYTLGEIANSKPSFLKNLLGKNGLILYSWVNGYDNSEVSDHNSSPPMKTIGNSTTAPKDLITDEDVKITLYLLCESVASRLRDYGHSCRTVQLTIRDKNLVSYQRQAPLIIPSCSSEGIFEKAYEIYKTRRIDNTPIRTLGVRGCNLVSNDKKQLSLIPEIQNLEKEEELERCIDNIRGRFGFYSIKRGLMLTDEELSQLNAKEEHTIYPKSFFHP